MVGGADFIVPVHKQIFYRNTWTNRDILDEIARKTSGNMATPGSRN